jgi:hypothetical protein
MQVSWIDPEEVAALAESLRPAARPQLVKAPEPAPMREAAQPLVAETPALETDAPGPAADTGGMPNLAAFRQRLQSIRERAISAGLMTPKPPPPPETPTASEPDAMRTGVSALRLVRPPAPVPEVVTPPEPAPESETETAPLPPQEPELVVVNEPEPVAAVAPAFEESASPSPEPVPEPVPEPPSQESAPQWQPQPVSFPAPNPPPVQYNVPISPAPTAQPHIEIAPGASVKDRLDAFASWAGQQWGPGELLIVDEYGDLLWGPPKKAGLVLSSMMAWNAAIRASAQAANGMAQIQQQVLATGETLTIIPCKTRLGMLQIAVVKAQAPWGEETSVLREALVQVMDIPG